MLQSTEGCSVLDPYKVHVRLQVQSNDVSRIVKPGLVSLSLDFKSNPRVSAAHFPCVSQAADKTSLLCLDVGKFQYWLPRHQWRWLTAFSLPPPPLPPPPPWVCSSSILAAFDVIKCFCVWPRRHWQLPNESRCRKLEFRIVQGFLVFPALFSPLQKSY